MARAKGNLRVNQKTKTVTGYGKSMETEDFERIEVYKNLGYKVSLLEKETPKARRNGINKDDMKIYLKGKIDEKIYNELVKKLESKKEKFFDIRSWLKGQLMAKAAEKKEKYIPFSTIIKVAKANAAKETAANIEEYENKNGFVKEEKEETEKK